MMQQEMPQGRILRVKTGYNPNSSSVGSQIPVFLAYAVSTGAAAIIISLLFNVVKVHLDRKKPCADAEKPE